MNKLFILFKKYLPNYKYYSPYSLCYLHGFNNKNDNMEESFDPEGYCVTVSYLYLYYFIYFIEKKEYYNITQSDIKFSILMSQLIQKNIKSINNSSKNDRYLFLTCDKRTQVQILPFSKLTVATKFLTTVLLSSRDLDLNISPNLKILKNTDLDVSLVKNFSCKSKLSAYKSKT